MITNSAHIPAYRHFSDNFFISAVSDINETAAKETAKRHNIPKYYTDAEQMLKNEKPDIVSVCVPNCLHKEYTLMALNYGANVLCEKPLAFTKKDAEEMFDCARKNNKLLVACQSMRFTPDRLAAKEYIKNNGLGEIYYGELSRIRRRGIPYWGSFHIKNISCGGAFVDIGVHMLDSLVWLMGNVKVKSVNAVTMQNHKDELGTLTSSGALTGKVHIQRRFNPDEMDVEDFCCGTVSFKNGAMVNFKVAWAANMPEESSIRIIGKKSGIAVPECKIYEGENNIKTLNTTPCIYESVFPGHIYIADNLRRVLNGEQDLIIKPEETINVSHIIELTYKSAQLGKEVYADEI